MCKRKLIAIEKLICLYSVHAGIQVKSRQLFMLNGRETSAHYFYLRQIGIGTQHSIQCAFGVGNCGSYWVMGNHPTFGWIYKKNTLRIS